MPPIHTEREENLRPETGHPELLALLLQAVKNYNRHSTSRETAKKLLRYLKNTKTLPTSNEIDSFEQALEKAGISKTSFVIHLETVASGLTTFRTNF